MTAAITNGLQCYSRRSEVKQSIGGVYQTKNTMLVEDEHTTMTTQTFVPVMAYM